MPNSLGTLHAADSDPWVGMSQPVVATTLALLEDRCDEAVVSLVERLHEVSKTLTKFPWTVPKRYRIATAYVLVRYH